MNKLIQKIRTSIQNLMKRGAFHIVAGSFLTKFVSFFGSVFLVRFLSKADYGILGYYENIFGYFTILAGCGLAGGLQRHIVLMETLPRQQGCYLTALRFGTLWNIGLVAVCAGFMLFYPHPAAFSGYPAATLALTACIPVLFVLNASLITLRATFQNRIYAILAFVTSATQILARIVGAYIGGLNGTTLFRFLAEVVCAAGVFLWLRRRVFDQIVPQAPSWEEIRSLRTYSTQMMFTDGLWAVFMLNDLFLLGQLCGSETLVADYKVAYVIPANISIFVAAIGVFVAPYFTKYENEGDYVWVRKNFLTLLKVNSSVMGAAALACFILAKPLILLLYGEDYLSAVPIMRVLLVASFFNNGIRSAIANVLSAMGKQKQNLYVAGAGMVIQVTLDLLCIPRFGVIGVAWASATVYFIMAFLLCAVFWKHYFRNPHSKQT